MNGDRLNPSSRVTACLLVLTIGVTWGQRANAQPGGPTLNSAELQPPVASNAVRSSLGRAEQFLQQKHLQDAVDLLVRLVENSGGELVPRREGVGWIRLDTYCQSLLCELANQSPEGLRLYQQQVDGLAQQWLQQGEQQADPAPLRRITNRLLASTVGDDALLLLGDLALQAGDVDQARHDWERISPALTVPVGKPAWLDAMPGEPLAAAAPWINSDERWEAMAASLAVANRALDSGAPTAVDRSVSLAVVRARFVLASMWEQDWDRAEAEWTLLDRLHPEAVGELAGKRGPLAPMLREILSKARQWQAPPASLDWPMTHQTPRRNGKVASAFELGQVLWSCELEPTPAPLERLFGSRRWPGEPDGPLPYEVATANGLVSVVESQRVRVLELESGAPAFGEGNGEIWRAPDWQAALTVNPDSPHAGVARFDAVMSGHRLLVRTGSAITSSSNQDEVKHSQLLAMDLNRQGRAIAGFPIDCQSSEAGDDGAGWTFEHAAPLLLDDAVYALVRWNDGVRSVLHLDCYALGTGERRWRTRLGGGRTWAQIAQAPEDPAWKELTHNRLTCAGDWIYTCTNLGLVCAVHAATGELQWATPYRRAVSTPHARHGHAARNAPPMVLGRRLIVAPRDTGALLAFDRFTGRQLWETPEQLTSNTVFMLGGDDDYLVVSGDRLTWIDQRSGAVLCRFPEGGAADDRWVRAAPSPLGCGRGLVTGNTVLWPTRNALYQFSVRPTLAAEQRWAPVGQGAAVDLKLRGLRGGNLSWSRGVLLVAGNDRLTAVGTYPLERLDAN